MLSGSPSTSPAWTASATIKVETLERARACAGRVEREENRRKLFPIRSFDFEAIQKWDTPMVGANLHLTFVITFLDSTFSVPDIVRLNRW